MTTTLTMVSSDAQLNKEWTPSARPQSLMAQEFSSALDNLFKMGDDLDHLSQNIFTKKASVLNQTTELEGIQARLRTTETRLVEAQKEERRRSQQVSPTRLKAMFEAEEKKKAQEGKQEILAGENAEKPEPNKEYVMVDRSNRS